MVGTLATRLMLKHLRLIAAIAEHGQLSIAAHALAMTQPAASRTLAEAESLVGVPLFARNPRGMTLTAAGESLARRARNILDELQGAAEEVDRLRLGRGGVVRIGAVTGAAVGYVAPAIRALRALVPDVELHVEVGTSEELMHGLLAMRHDMMLGRLPARLPPEPLSVRPARGEVARIVAHADHASAGPDPVALADLLADEWVIQGTGTPIRRAVDEAFLAHGPALPLRVINTASLLMVMALLRGPGIVTAVSQEVAQLLTEGRSGLVILNVAQPIHVAPYALITLRDRRLSPVATHCLEVLGRLVAQDPPG
ncbi:LysR family transcriptional regulator [Paracoccaceae bacterium Fryx2]|nr:LysR family transcriptional regulator [Paracoccaceae bacterium Fryx2]